MDRRSDRTGEVMPGTLEHERRLIQDAIAVQAGVRVVPLRRADEAGVDIAIEWIAE
ncbi:MAG TPA: hypothetical protein VLM76_05120 [Patescibacteria group bacterium]|nr:hypothetical protein [Patescibacteria group bacterium]